MSSDVGRDLGPDLGLSQLFMSLIIPSIHSLNVSVLCKYLSQL